MTEKVIYEEKYSSYKNSGVDWLGEIPSEWQLLPALRFIEESKQKNVGMIEDQVLSLSYGNIITKSQEQLTGLVPESFETYQIVEDGDIIIRGTDLQNDKKSLRTGLSKCRGIITSAYLNLRPKKGVSPRFLHYFFHSMDTSKSLYKYGSGLRQNLSFEDFKRMPIPDLTEASQKAIANFLDDKTEKIERAIAIKEKQIELLKERKQILIQNAVTRGLNPDAPMKDSGVDWIGEIPAHWELKKLKYLVEIKKRIIGYEGPDVLSITQKGIKIKDIKSGEGQLAMNYSKYQIINKGEFGMNHMDLLTGYVDISKHEGVISPDYRVFDIFNLQMTHGYLLKIFQNGYHSKIFYRYGQGVSLLGRWRLPATNFNNFIVPIPPVSEQNAIIEFIENKNVQVRKIEQQLILQIQKLKEYKASLVNSAVTGKIKITA